MAIIQCVLNDRYPDSTCGAKVIQVIEQKVKYTERNIERVVTVYRTLDGDILAANDPYGEGMTLESIFDDLKKS